MKSFREILNEAAIEGKPDQMAVPYADTLAQNVNVREIPSGSNRGSEIDRYFDLVGLDNEAHYNSINPKTKRPFHKGYPWCAAFVYAMFHDFCKKLGLKNPLVRTAGVMKSWNRADESLKIPISQARANFNLVKPGQIFIQKRKGGGHTGIVTAVNTKNKTFTTIEGNTNDKLSGEGHRVGRNTRKLSQGSLVGFIDYFKGHRNNTFEKTVAKVVAEAPTDYSSEEYIEGLSKNDIKKIQLALLKLGYDLGNFGPNKDGVDGEIGTKTTDAVNDWKLKNNMKSDSVIDKEVYSLITKDNKFEKTSGGNKKQKSTGDISIDPNVNYKKVTNSVQKMVNQTIKVIMPNLFPNKLVTVDSTNISNDPGLVIKRAIIESTKSVNKFSDLILEKNWINRIKDAKKSRDTKLADQYRDGRVESSPIDGTGALQKSAANVKDIINSKPEVDIIYNKQLNVFYIKPYNQSAIKALGTANVIKMEPKDFEELQIAFKDVTLSTQQTDPKPETNNTANINTVNLKSTLSNVKPLPSNSSETTIKGSTIANDLVKDLNITKEVAAGIVGNLWAESGLVPDRIQGSGMKRGTLPQAKNGGYGWAQYTHPSLKSDLIAFAKKKGVDLNSQPMSDELNYEYLKHWVSKNSNKFTELKSQGDVKSATNYFLTKYERPADQSERALNKRVNFANSVYSRMA
jgi:hypothetical protein